VQERRGTQHTVTRFAAVYPFSLWFGFLPSVTEFLPTWESDFLMLYTRHTISDDSKP
jgi:hypothetical protein